jgi:hypothetical protein
MFETYQAQDYQDELLVQPAAQKKTTSFLFADSSEEENN